jgi:hypothetical protein
VPVMSLANRCGLHGLDRQHVTIAVRTGVNRPPGVTSPHSKRPARRRPDSPGRMYPPGSLLCPSHAHIHTGRRHP